VLDVPRPREDAIHNITHLLGLDVLKAEGLNLNGASSVDMETILSYYLLVIGIGALLP